MNLKRIVAIALMTVLLVVLGGSLAETYVFPVETATPTDTDISMSDAISIAKSEVTQRQGLALEDIANYKIVANFVKLENFEEAWIVTLFEDEMYYPTDSTLIISSIDATVIDYQASDMGLGIQLMKQWEKRKGKRETWSLEDLALFGMLYATSSPNAIPSDNMLSKEEASIIALSALSQSPLLPEFQYSFWHLTSDAGMPDEYIWGVTILVNREKIVQVNLSATDGSIMEIIDLGGGHG